MIAVTFALPQESKDFQADLRAPGGLGERLNGAVLGNLGPRELILCHTGIGRESAAHRVRQLLSVHTPECLISAGFAGALNPRLSTGDLLVATNSSDLRLLAKIKKLETSAQRWTYGELITVDEVIETQARKKELRRASGAEAVDMETSAIHSVCAKAGVPMLSLRAISDAAGDSLPVPFAKWFDAKRQKPRVLALLVHLARHPRCVRPFTQFVLGVSEARHQLTNALRQIVPAL